MKLITWNAEKKELLKAQRGVSFEDVVYHILAGDIVETINPPNQDRYPGQQVHVIAIEEYIYLVPFVESAEARHLILAKQYRLFRQRAFVSWRNAAAL